MSRVVPSIQHHQPRAGNPAGKDFCVNDGVSCPDASRTPPNPYDKNEDFIHLVKRSAGL